MNKIPAFPTLLVIFFFSIKSFSADIKVADSEDKLINMCEAQLHFSTSPSLKEQTLKLNENMSLNIVQALAIKESAYGTKVATNVICQRLKGASYTGTEQEWAQFMQQAIGGLKRSEGKNLRLQLLGEDENYYNGLLPHKEYKFYGEFKGIKQAIVNVAILDKTTNTVYTISVSGAEKGEIAIKEELTRVISNLVLPVK